MAKIIILIVAGGRGTRIGGDVPKQYVELCGRSVLARTIDAFINHSLVENICTVIHRDDLDLYKAATQEFGDRLLPPAMGGPSRQDSARKGLKYLIKYDPDLVLIHDGARPFVDKQLINRIIDGLSNHDAVLPVISVTDTIKQVKDKTVAKTVDRANLYSAQTPQGFRFSHIIDLHEQAQKTPSVEFTDDASIAEWAGIDVHTIEGSLDNQKLTTKRDMELAELILAKQAGEKMQTRTGLGFDVHRFEPGDGVILCGIKIPYNKKLKGHSDADVAMHALTDAILGAIGKGDIGSHFPPSEARWKGVASSTFLEHAVTLLQKCQAEIVNVDVTIICEQPKIGPHREKMIAELARIMKLDAHRISVKATTTEQLGFTGRGEGIAAQAVASISMPSKGD